MISTPTNVFLVLLLALAFAFYFTILFIQQHGPELLDICNSAKSVQDKYHELNNKLRWNLGIYIWMLLFILGFLAGKLV